MSWFLDFPGLGFDMITDKTNKYILCLCFKTLKFEQGNVTGKISESKVLGRTFPFRRPQEFSWQSSHAPPWLFHLCVGRYVNLTFYAT